MKKMITAILALVFLLTFSIPALADDFYTDQTISEDKSCAGMVIHENIHVKINSYVEICRSPILILGKNSTVTVGSNGMLTGEGIMLVSSNDAKIIIEDGGAINISFFDTSQAEEFAALLGKNGIHCRQVNERVIAPCPHASTSPVNAFVCDDCGELLAVDTHTASILSQGYPEIVYGIGGLAIGFFAAMLIFRKKKVAVSSTAADDEE